MADPTRICAGHASNRSSRARCSRSSTSTSSRSLRTLGGEGSAFSQHMKDARLGIPTPALLAKAVEKLDAVHDGGSRHQGRRLRVHARQDRQRRAERPVPHTAPHHRADGRADQADADRRHLRSGRRHMRLPRRRRRISTPASSRGAARSEAAQAFPRDDVQRLRFRRHDAAHRLDEHDPARHRERAYRLPRLPGRRAQRGRQAATAWSSPIRHSPARWTTRQPRRICSRWSRRRRRSCCSSRSSSAF